MAREIFDSRGWPTVQCEIILDHTFSVTASVPTGISRSTYEAYELRDNDKRLWGKGVTQAVDNIENSIAQTLINQEPNGPVMDMMMLNLDGTENKSHLGANALLAVSMALYKAQAVHENMQLYELFAHITGQSSISIPMPHCNIVNGGLHSNNSLLIQEFLLIPMGAPSFKDAIEICITIFNEVKSIMHKYGKVVGIGDEGGLSPYNTTDEEVLDYMWEAIERLHEKTEISCIIGLDLAATQWYDRSKNAYHWNNNILTADEMISLYYELINNYPILSLEDPLAEDDFAHWQKLTEQLNNIQIVGDDLFSTNLSRIQYGIQHTLATAAIIKPNQIGTITETLQAIKLCKEYGINTIISHRSGETEDTFITDLSVGTNAGQIKAGGCCRSERMAKYNRLLTIEDHLSRTE